MAKKLVDVVTFPRFLEWVKARPPYESFKYNSITTCALAQFLRAEGFEGAVAEGSEVFTGNGDRCLIPNTIRLPMGRMTAMASAIHDHDRMYSFGTLAAYLEGRA